MRIISFGDLFIDYYLNKGNIIGVCGGKSNANILANLSRYYDTAFIGCCGNDTQGKIAIDSLEKLGVDVSNIDIVDAQTKTFFLEKDKFTKECPYCHRHVSYHGTKVDFDKVLNNIGEYDVIVVDNVNTSTLNIIKNVDNKAFIDIGYLGNLMYASLDEIIDSIGNRFEIINMNEKVYNILKRKFEIDSMDLYELLKPKILIITRGKRGTDIIYNGIFDKKEIIVPVNEVEVSGAGDAFFSEFIRTYLEYNEVNEKIISLAYMRASSLSRYVVTNVGARTHLEPLYIINNYKECICKEIETNIL